MSEFRLIPYGRNLGVTILAGVLILAFSGPAEAIDLSPSSGSFQLNLDTTLSWGGRYRVAEIDQSIIGTAAGVLVGVLLAYVQGLRTFGSEAWGLLPGLAFVKIVAGSLLAGVVMTIGGALYPAWRAAKMEPVDAMRTEV